MDENNKFKELRENYSTFIFEKYEIEEKEDCYKITYYFNIPKLIIFTPSLEIKKDIINKIDEYAKYLIFNVGMIELISYWKCCCCPNVIIKAGYLNKAQLKWFKRQYYFGLGELFYTNNIKTDINSFMSITCDYKRKNIVCPNYKGQGNMIAVGGGKDSCVSLEILNNIIEDNTAFIINPKDTTLKCASIAGYANNVITVKRNIDRNIININEQGFINGHTPFSALVAFLSYLVAYLYNKKYIVLSNEASANQPTVPNTKINHQYSKTFEFENDFNKYASKYFKISIKYFSLLRCLNELQIAMFFSNYKKYHKIFNSCNVGSKKEPWHWCCNCPKCLFVYIILSAFLSENEIKEIFGQNLYESKELLNYFLELCGEKEVKPFECVGTVEEVNFAINLTINRLKEQNKELPYLLDYYQKHCQTKETGNNILKDFNKKNNIPTKFSTLVKKELNKYV